MYSQRDESALYFTAMAVTAALPKEQAGLVSAIFEFPDSCHPPS